MSVNSTKIIDKYSHNYQHGSKNLSLGSYLALLADEGPSIVMLKCCFYPLGSKICYGFVHIM